MEKKKKEKVVYYSLERILKEKCDYNLIIGERSNGKSYSLKLYAIEQYFKNGSEAAFVCRMAEDWKKKRAKTYFEDIVHNGLVEKLSKGEWDDIIYSGEQWYFARFDSELNKKVYAEKPFAYSFTLSSMEHDKKTSYPRIRTIVFEEFLTRGGYLPDEFIMFQNVVSTIVRLRDDIKIFMLGNTVNAYSPYFKEMGLDNIKNIKEGDIQVYTWGDNFLRIAVELAPSVITNNKKGKKSDKYFAFNNPKLKMITEGKWEMNLYPHLPIKYKHENIKLTYFIEFDDTIMQCEIIHLNGNLFTYIHRKTTPFRNSERDIIFSQTHSPLPNWRRRITDIHDDIGRIIYKFFIMEKVFYQDNELGEVVRNYLLWCTDDRGVLE